jgi:GNAT superfamily N-acetyltransferase
MITEYPLTKANRLKLSRAFKHNPRVDLSIPCIVESQMGKAFVDDPENPLVYRIEQGPFYYFAGDPNTPGGRAMIANLPPYTLFMPSPPAWIEAIQKMYSGKLVPFDRYSFSSDNLTIEHLDRLLTNSNFKDIIQRMDIPITEKALLNPDGYVDLFAFDSAEDFYERGIGYYLLENEKMIGVAYSSLVCSIGIEVSLVVDPDHHRQGIATALCCHLLKFCLENGMRPNWDAANPESCALALKLGYKPTGSYESYYLKE